MLQVTALTKEDAAQCPVRQVLSKVTGKWQLLIVLFIFGVGLAFVVWRTGSLWSGIAVHAANNLASALLLTLR